MGNYILVFRYAQGTVDLLAVLHASRDVASHFDKD